MKIIRNCDVCSKEYTVKSADLKRGWGLTCSKSCASKKREMSKPGYDPAKVLSNNHRRQNWNNQQDDDFNIHDDDDPSWGSHKNSF